MRKRSRRFCCRTRRAGLAASRGNRPGGGTRSSAGAATVAGGTGWRPKSPAQFKSVGNRLRLAQIDWEAVRQETVKRFDAFWSEWQALVNGKRWGSPFEGPRDRALALGLIECKDASELTGAEWKTLAWDTPDTPPAHRRNRFDVLMPTTREELLASSLDAFSPLSSWAYLDSSGWYEKGKMGRFACSDATPDSVQAHAKNLVEWLQSGDQDDWLVVVDCHI